MNLRHFLYFSSVSLFWGGSFLAIHYVVQAFPPGFGAFVRIVIGLTAMTLLVATRKKNEPVHFSIKAQAFFAGWFNVGIPWILLFYGEKFVSPALSAIYNSTTTIFVALLTPLLIAQAKLSRKNIFGIVIGFMGVLFIVGPNVSGNDIQFVHAQIALLVMSVCYAIGTIWLKRFSHRMGLTKNLQYQFFGSSVLLGLYSFIFEAPWALPFSAIPASSYIAVLYLAIFSTFLAWIMYAALVHERGGVQAASVLYVVPCISILLDWLILGKLVKLTDLIGAAIIFAGVWLIQKKQLKF